MRKAWLALGVGLAFLSTQAAAQETPKAGAAAVELPKCPVMGEDRIDLSTKIMTDSGPVYFCCGECIAPYKKEPAKYADKVKAQQAALKKVARVQVNCPIEGAAIDKTVFVEKDGQKTYFCCDKCKGAYEKDAAKYANALEGSYTYQTKCPVMGKGIDPASYVELANGKRIYFCCKMCDKKLLAEPAKYVAKLSEQGYNYDPKDMKAAAPAGGEKKDAPKAGGEKKEEKKP